MQQYQPIYAKDYTPPTFLIDTVDLHVNIRDEQTIVTAKLNIRHNPDSNLTKAPLVLNGTKLNLHYVKLDDRELLPSQYNLTDTLLTINVIPDNFILETQVSIDPTTNKSLCGLFKTGENLCSQCEPDGFSHITYFIDRPDILAKYTTTIEADKSIYPVLLSNGNLVAQGDLEHERHWVTWQDPSCKSPHIFALVAGKFACLEDQFITKQQRSIKLQIYAPATTLHQCQHAMQALKAAMQWEEDNFAATYDLDVYMLVAIDDLNAAAMENKGLNVFNSDYLLAAPEIATDNDHIKVATVIAHEYFHNWTGNLVAARDWFQLGWKEGLTTFREQLFAADHFSPAIQRINEARFIRNKQFAEDSSPLAHPIRLQSYIEINNFYTVTIYYKSAEVARMLQTLVGKDMFRKIIETFFKRYVGKTVTIEDFLNTAASVSKLDLTQFKLWYDQKGTPEVTVTSNYNASQQTLALTITQTSTFPEQQAYYFPFQMAAFTASGKQLNLDLPNDILLVKNSTENVAFKHISEKPVLSLCRNFSAPIKLNYQYTPDELLCLMLHDTDAVNQWQAAQELITQLIVKLYAATQNHEELHLPQDFATAIKTLLTNTTLDPALVAQMLQFPAENYLLELMPHTDVGTTFQIIEFIKRELAQQLTTEFLNCYQQHHVVAPYTLDASAIGNRALKNVCLHYLNYCNSPAIITIALQQLNTANNLTDILGALGVLVNSEIYAERDGLLEQYYQKWQNQHTVINKWLALNATIKLPGTLERIKKLLTHPAFAITNPTNVIALLRNFTESNWINFHQISGAGYEFLTEQILKIDTFNPQLAVNIAITLTRWQKYDPQRQKLQRQQLEKILKQPNISKNLFEIASKAES